MFGVLEIRVNLALLDLLHLVITYICKDQFASWLRGCGLGKALKETLCHSVFSFLICFAIVVFATRNKLAVSDVFFEVGSCQLMDQIAMVDRNQRKSCGSGHGQVKTTLGPNSARAPTNISLTFVSSFPSLFGRRTWICCNINMTFEARGPRRGSIYGPDVHHDMCSLP